MISFSVIKDSVVEVLTQVQPWHWAIIALVPLAVAAVALLRKRASAGAVVCLTLTVLSAMLLVESTVLIRLAEDYTNGSGVHLTFDLDRLRHINQLGYEALMNIIAFAPFGFFMALYLAARKPLKRWRAFALATGATLALSLCIETLQLLLQRGFFELTDLLFNTAGGCLGAGMALLAKLLLSLKS